METYHIRLDNKPCVKDLLSSLCKLSKIYAYAGEEGSKNPHHHVLLLSDFENDAEIRKTIKSYEYKGNKDFSISVIRDKVKALCYIMKDHVKDIKEEVGKRYENKLPLKVFLFKPEYYRFENIEREDFETALKMSEEINKDRSKGPIWKKILLSLTDEQKDRMITVGEDRTRVDTDMLIGIIVDYHVDRDLMISQSRIIQYVDTIISKLYAPKIKRKISLAYDKQCQA